jgi:hypothetical protein
MRTNQLCMRTAASTANNRLYWRPLAKNRFRQSAHCLCTRASSGEPDAEKCVRRGRRRQKDDDLVHRQTKRRPGRQCWNDSNRRKPQQRDQLVCPVARPAVRRCRWLLRIVLGAATDGTAAATLAGKAAGGGSMNSGDGIRRTAGALSRGRRVNAITFTAAHRSERHRLKHNAENEHEAEHDRFTVARGNGGNE